MSIESVDRGVTPRLTGSAPAEGSVARLQARRAAIGLALVTIPLPLQWYDLGKGALGTIRIFHITALLMVVVARPTWSMVRAALNQVRPLYGAAGGVVLIGLVTSIGWRSGVTQFPQGAFYMLASIVAAACLIVALQDEAGQRILARTTPISLAVFLLALVSAVRGASIDIASQFAQAFAGNPHALQFGLFRAAFRTVEPAVRSSVRHEVFGGLVIVLYIGIVASVRANYLRKVTAVCALIVFPLAAFSLSRSVMVGVALTALVGLGRVLLSGRIRILSFLFGLAVLGSLPLIIPKIVPLLSAKVNSTGSYGARLGAINAASQIDLERLLLGGPLLDSPTQILFVDVTLRAGLVAGIAALVVEAVFIVSLVKLIGAYYRTGSIAVLAAVGAAFHVLVRSLTGGGNLMDLVEWMGFALVIAVLYLESNGSPATAPSSVSRATTRDSRARRVRARPPVRRRGTGLD